MTAVQDRLGEAWAFSDGLFEMIAPEAWSARPIALRHPFLFYLGHLPAFGWNQVCGGVLQRPGLRPEFDDLFERGIDPLDDDADVVTTQVRWPDVVEVLDYRDRVRGALLDAYEEVCGRDDDPMAREGRVYHVVLEHELMHHETLLYMIQQLDRRQQRRPADLPAPAVGPGRPRTTCRIPAGEAVIGAAFEAQPFGWDNEFPERRTAVAAFEIDAVPVTNADFMVFVEDGGYGRRDLWEPEAYDALHRSGRAHPFMWRRAGGAWSVQTLFDDVALDDAAHWPVYVSLAEARAFSRWSGRRLPTEPELNRAAYGSPDGAWRAYPWGDAAPTARHGNFGFTRWAPDPVGSHPEGASAFGVHELLGNGWEWTETTFASHEGFDAYMPDYPGYSADFFDGQHFVMLGGSWATAPELLRRSFRNWFQPHYPFVFAGFRLVSDV